MAKYDGAKILARALKNEGIDRIFTLSGGHIFRVYQECEKIGIETVDFRHEGAAAYAAEAYAIATGKPAVVVLTAGPGVTNAMTQLADCNYGRVPVLFIGGASAQMHNLYDVLQQYDTLTMMKPHTRFCERVEETRRIADYVAAAYRHMLAPHIGPAYIEIPMDILELNEVEESEVNFPERYRSEARMFGDPALIAQAADLLISAERPVMFVGDGSQYGCKNYTVFQEMAEYLQIPTDFSEGNLGRYCTEDDQPLFQTANLAANQADCILLLNFKPFHTIAKNMNREAKMISVSRYAEDIGLNLPIDVGIVGQADAVAEQLLEVIKRKTEKRSESDYVESLMVMREAMLESIAEGYDSDDCPIRPARLAYDIYQFLNSEAGHDFCYFPDGGDCLTWATLMRTFVGMKHWFPGRFALIPNLGGVGYSMGATTGLYCAVGKPVIHSIGDGSMGFYLGELFTYAKMKMPHVLVIFNDGYWGMIKAFSMAQDPDLNHDIGQVIAPRNGDSYYHYERIAEAWGGYGTVVSRAKDILPEIKKAAESVMEGKPAIVNVLMGCKEEYFSFMTNSLYQELTTPSEF